MELAIKIKDFKIKKRGMKKGKKQLARPQPGQAGSQKEMAFPGNQNLAPLRSAIDWNDGMDF